MNINAAKTSVALQEVRAIQAYPLPLARCGTTKQRQAPYLSNIAATSALNWLLFSTLIISVAVLLLLLLCRKALWFHHKKKKIDQLQQLFGIIAHDLRSPFKSYHNLVELLDHYGKKQDWNSIKMIARELEVTSRNMDLLLDTLLHRHLLESGNIKRKNVPISVAEVFQKIIPIYQQTAKYKESYIDLNIINCANVSVEQTLTTLIFRNLIDNAVKYAPGGSPIVIEVARTSNVLTCAITNSFHPRSQKIVSELRKAFIRKKDSIQTGIGIHFMIEAAKVINATLNARIADADNKLTITVTIPCI